jgi:hypothetical protein
MEGTQCQASLRCLRWHRDRVFPEGGRGPHCIIHGLKVVLTRIVLRE